MRFRPQEIQGSQTGQPDAFGEIRIMEGRVSATTRTAGIPPRSNKERLRVLGMTRVEQTTPRGRERVTSTPAPYGACPLDFRAGDSIARAAVLRLATGGSTSDDAPWHVAVLVGFGCERPVPIACERASGEQRPGSLC